MEPAAQRLAAVRAPVSTVWTSPDAPRDIDAPAIAATPDLAGWCRALDTDARMGLHGRTLTQLLYGEPVLIRTERQGWAEIVAPWQPSSADELGYPGWLPASHLGELPAAASDPVAVIVPTAALIDRPGPASILAELSFGTILASTDHRAGYTEVALPDGGRGWLLDTTIRPAGEPASAETRLQLGRQFLGLEYLWGGTSAYGLDCSGLVHAVSRVLGVRVPRDAHDQHAALEPVGLDAAEPGDLYFFARQGKPVHHVGFISPAGMLDASETGQVLQEAAIPSARRDTLVGAARLPVPVQRVG